MELKCDCVSVAWGKCQGTVHTEGRGRLPDRVTLVFLEVPVYRSRNGSGSAAEAGSLWTGETERADIIKSGLNFILKWREAAGCFCLFV